MSDKEKSIEREREIPNYMETGIKSTERVNKFGEVYTPHNIVCDMLNLVGDAAYDIDKTMLEPACGNGNFMIEMIKRKMEGAIEAAKESGAQFDILTLKAVSTIYGVDIIPDNVEETKERMLNVVKTVYEEYTGIAFTGDLEKSVKFIMNKNVILGDTLKQVKLRTKNDRVGRKAKVGYVAETEEDGDLMISSWEFDMQKETVKRTVYSFRNMEILDHEHNPVHYLRLWRQREIIPNTDGII